MTVEARMVRLAAASSARPAMARPSALSIGSAAAPSTMPSRIVALVVSARRSGPVMQRSRVSATPVAVTTRLVAPGVAGWPAASSARPGTRVTWRR
jgi:hypothetical protein